MSKEERKNIIPDIPESDGTISLTEFMNLDRKIVAPHRKVNWDAVLEDIIETGKPFSTTTIRQLANTHSYQGNPVNLYYSEIVRVITKWDRDETLEMMKRRRESDGRVFYYLIRRVEE